MMMYVIFKGLCPEWNQVNYVLLRAGQGPAYCTHNRKYPFNKTAEYAEVP